MAYVRSAAGSKRGRLIVALVIAAVAVIGYVSQCAENPLTGEKQNVALTVEQEIALGLQAAPEMAREFGGQLADPQAQARVDRIGARLVKALVESLGEGQENPYRFEFHVLADAKTVNAFALPGGQVFITRALLDQFTTDGQVAGVLGHEVGHVVERHGAQHMSKGELLKGLGSAAAIYAYDPENPGRSQIPIIVAQLINLKYGRDDELESDRWGVKIMAQAGYDPHALIAVMDVLERAGGGAGQPEFFSTHPNPENRRGRIREAIDEVYPEGVPDGLEK